MTGRKASHPVLQWCCGSGFRCHIVSHAPHLWEKLFNKSVAWIIAWMLTWLQISLRSKHLSLSSPSVFAYNGALLMCSRWYSTAVLPGRLVFSATYNSLQLQFACWAGYWEIWCSCTDRLSSVRLAERLNEIKGVQGALGSAWWWLPCVFLRDAREWELHGCFPSYMWHLSSQPAGNSTLATCAQRVCGYQIFKKCRNIWRPAWKWFHETEMWSVRMSSDRLMWCPTQHKVMCHTLHRQSRWSETKWPLPLVLHTWKHTHKNVWQYSLACGISVSLFHPLMRCVCFLCRLLLFSCSVTELTKYM